VTNGGRRVPAPALLVLIAATLWGTLGVSWELVADRYGMDRITLVTIRAWTATFFLMAWMLARRRSLPPIGVRDLPRFAGLGLVTVTIFYPVLAYSYDWNGVSAGTVLLYTAPAMVAVGAALFLKEALHRRHLVGIALAFVGCLLVTGLVGGGDVAVSARGIAMGLASGALYGAYSLLAKPMMRVYAPDQVLALHFLFGAIGLTVIKLATDPTDWPSWQGVLATGGYNGIVTTLAPLTLYTLGLRRMPAAEASLLATWEPVVAVALAYLILGERLTVMQGLGALCIIGCVVLLTALGRSKRGTAAG